MKKELKPTHPKYRTVMLMKFHLLARELKAGSDAEKNQLVKDYSDGTVNNVNKLTTEQLVGLVESLSQKCKDATGKTVDELAESVTKMRQAVWSIMNQNYGMEDWGDINAFILQKGTVKKAVIEMDFEELRLTVSALKEMQAKIQKSKRGEMKTSPNPSLTGGEQSISDEAIETKAKMVAVKGGEEE